MFPVPRPSPVHRVCSVDYSSTTEQLFNQQHHGESSEFRAWTNDNGADYDLEKQLTIRQVASLFPRLNNISFECTELETDVPNTVDDDLPGTNSIHSKCLRRVNADFKETILPHLEIVD